MLSNIEKLMIDEIRPYLSQHYGDIEVISFEGGILSVRLLGQCSGCPGAKYTIEDFVEAKIIEAIPQVKEVSLVNDISNELYDFGRQLLNRNIEGE